MKKSRSGRSHPRVLSAVCTGFIVTPDGYILTNGAKFCAECGYRLTVYPTPRRERPLK
jgi:S1-C subfamily serine protease